MPGLLPDDLVEITRVNPKIFIIYSKPKVGKTKLLSLLTQQKNALVLDTEGGTEMYKMRKMRLTGLTGSNIVYDPKNPGRALSMTFDDFVGQMGAYASSERAAGRVPKPPYDYLAVDTLDIIEDWAEGVATWKYRNSPIGKTFEGMSVLELPKGAGYYYLRNEVLDRINLLTLMCKYLILVCHVREKNIDKGGIEVSVTDLSLAGKLNLMVSAAADAIGYLSRDEGKDPIISFATSEGITMGSRMPHLAGKTFSFDWDKIYLPEEVPVAMAAAAR
jgi:hypothetical protein